jgi:cytochrome c oxidase subunit 2
MPIVVIAMNQPEYDVWVKKTEEEAKEGPNLNDQSRDQLMAKGAAVYEKNCATCHLPGGEGVPGAFPALKGSAIVNGDISVQLHLVMNGKNAMPAFGKVLKADELAQVITYTRNALGNSVGDEIQPKGIQSSSPEATESAVEDEPEKPVASTVDLSKDDLIAKGKTVYETNCASCHQADGKGMPPTFPALTGSSVVTGDINAQVKFILNGKGMMPAFGKMLNPTDFAAVVTYTRNGLGNSVNDSIKPSAIQALQ